MQITLHSLNHEDKTMEKTEISPAQNLKLLHIKITKNKIKRRKCRPGK